MKYLQYKVALMYTVLLSQRTSPKLTSLHFTSKTNIISHKSRQFTSHHYISIHLKAKSLHIKHVSSLHITTLHFKTKSLHINHVSSLITTLHFKTKSLHINHVSSLHITTLHFTSKQNKITSHKSRQFTPHH